MNERIRKLSVIIPVFHETERINRTIGHLFSPGEGCEVIVVDGSPEGGTLSGIQDGRVTKLRSEKGRGRQMNRGASVAGGDVFLFLHADTELPPDVFSSISEKIDEGYDCGAFELGIRSERLRYRLIEGMVRLRTRATRIPYGDQAIFVKRELFQRLNGFREIPLMEDVDFMRRVKRVEGKICIIPRRVKTSARRWEEEGFIYCTLRNWTLMALYLSGVDPEKLVRFYYRPLKGKRRRG